MAEPDTFEHDQDRDTVAVQRWTRALESLEARVRAAAAGQDLEPWQEPDNLGPLPPELAQWARGVLQANEVAIEAVRARQRQHRKTQHLAGRVDQATGHRGQGSYITRTY